MAFEILINIGSDNITWTNVDSLSVGIFGFNPRAISWGVPMLLYMYDEFENEPFDIIKLTHFSVDNGVRQTRGAEKTLALWQLSVFNVDLIMTET